MRNAGVSREEGYRGQRRRGFHFFTRRSRMNEGERGRRVDREEKERFSRI